MGFYNFDGSQVEKVVDLSHRKGSWMWWALRDIERKTGLAPGVFRRWVEGGRRPQKSYVYFIKPITDNIVKIGFSTDLKQRLYSLQMDSWSKLEVLTYLPGTLETERTLHENFSHLHVRGEWFEYAADLPPFIDRVATIEQKRGNFSFTDKLS